MSNNRPICVIQSPIATRSGYGEMARDIAHHILDMNKYDVKLISTAWGATPMTALNDSNPMDKRLLNHIVHPPVNLPRKPELFVHITVPNEFQPMGEYNIGITAGIETTACSVPWLEGCNRMNLILAISEHSKRVLLETTAEARDQQGRVLQQFKVTKPVETLHNCVYTDVYKKIPSTEIIQSVDDALLAVKEKFVFLFVGHWLHGDLGHDRKNVGMLVRVFCETFKNITVAKRPALILKTSGAGFSVLDRERLLSRIAEIREQSGPNSPNVYLLHGDLTEQEMNSLYNHPKIKAHVSLTHGEGFGRPLLEATMSEKPIIASGWSGQLDFLNPQDALLVGGKLENVHPSAVWKDVIIPESQWFIPDYNQVAGMFLHAFNNYDILLPGAKRLAEKNRIEFSYDAIKQKTKELFDKYVPEFKVPQLAQIKLPPLKKIDGSKLPTLKKIDTPIKEGPVEEKVEV